MHALLLCSTSHNEFAAAAACVAVACFAAAATKCVCEGTSAPVPPESTHLGQQQSTSGFNASLP